MEGRNEAAIVVKIMQNETKKKNTAMQCSSRHYSKKNVCRLERLTNLLDHLSILQISQKIV